MVELQVNFIYGLGDLIASTNWAVNLCQQFRERGWESEVVITTLGNAYYTPGNMSVFDIIDKNSIAVPIQERIYRHLRTPEGKMYVYTTREPHTYIGYHWIDIFCSSILQSKIQQYLKEQEYGNKYAYSAHSWRNKPLPKIKIEPVYNVYNEKLKLQSYKGIHIRTADENIEIENYQLTINNFFKTANREEKYFLATNNIMLKNYIKENYEVDTYQGGTEENIGYQFRHQNEMLETYTKEEQIQNVKDIMTDMIAMSTAQKVYSISMFNLGRLSNFLYLSILKSVDIEEIQLIN